MIPFFKLLKTKTLMWTALAFMGLLSSIAIGCSSDPVVVERIVEVPVEKVVVKEVIKEVVVTPAPTREGTSQTAVAQSTVAPTRSPAANNKSILLVADTIRFYTQVVAMGFSEGILVKNVRDIEASGTETHMIPNDIEIESFPGMIVLGWRPTYELIKQVRSYVESGGTAAIVLFRCNSDSQEALQFTFGISCTAFDPSFHIRGRGEQFAPFFGGLFMELIFVTIGLVPGSSNDSRCVAKVQSDFGTVCTALYGTAGHGRYIFMISGSKTASWMNDSYIHEKDNREAALRLLNWLVEEPSSRALPPTSFDAASVLARFSTSDPVEGEQRADAVGDIIALHNTGNPDTARILVLLQTIAPELSISERRQAADKLASISEDGQWDEGETAKGIFYLASLITGEEPNPEERIEAAHEMVALYEAGDLDAETTLGLMDTIAPSLSINERRQAAAALSKLSAEVDWDDEDRMRAASEVFRLVTGVPLDAEGRLGAAVDLTGVGMKIFDTDDSFEERDIDTATEIIKQSLTGELTTEGLQNILGGGR